MATIIIHAGHFKPGNIRSWWTRLAAEDASAAFPDVMRLTDVATGSVIYYKLEDLAELEVASEESTKKMMGAIGWGLVGDLALGPLGLLAGVLSGGKQTNVKFIGNFKDGRRMLATTDSKTFTAMQAALFNKTLAPISPPEPAAQPTQVDKPAAQPTQVVWRSPRTKIGDATKRQTFLLFGGLIALVTVFSLIGGDTKPAVQPTLVVKAAAPIVVSDGCDFRRFRQQPGCGKCRRVRGVLYLLSRYEHGEAESQPGAGHSPLAESFSIALRSGAGCLPHGGL